MSLLAQTRPRRATEIVDASFQLYKAHFGDLLVISALLLVPPALITALVPTSFQPVIQFGGNIMFLVCQGAVAVLVAAAVESDQRLSAGQAIRELGTGTANVIAVSIMAGILVMLGLILLIVPGIIALAWTMVSTPVVAVEELTSWSALKRSRELVRGHIGHVLGTMALSWVIVLVLVIGSALAMGLVFGVFGLAGRLSNLIGGLFIVPLAPLIGVTMTLLYYDLRVRAEGADVIAMADVLPVVPVPTNAP
jgi:hypothetical protein